MKNNLNWISIKDKKPEFDKYMQAWTNRGEIVEAVYIIDPVENKPWMQLLSNDACSCCSDWQVTHYIYNEDFPFPDIVEQTRAKEKTYEEEPNLVNLEKAINKIMKE